MFITSSLNLGEYLENLPKEKLLTNLELPTEKYSFIKGNGWNF